MDSQYSSRGSTGIIARNISEQTLKTVPNITGIQRIIVDKKPILIICIVNVSPFCRVLLTINMRERLAKESAKILANGITNTENATQVCIFNYSSDYQYF